MPWIKRANRNNEWRMEIGEYTLILTVTYHKKDKCDKVPNKIIRFDCGVYKDGFNEDEDMWHHEYVELHTVKTQANYRKYIKRITHQCLKYVKEVIQEDYENLKENLEEAVKVDANIELVIK